ncbi:MAG: NAD(P)-dependent oxidoreductase [Litorivicinus sp.]
MIPFLSTASVDDQTRWLDSLNNNAHGLTFEAGLTSRTRQSKVAVFTAPAAAQLHQFPKLHWAQCTWAGVDKALGLTDTPIARLIDPGLTDIMAEAVLAWSLYLHREMPHYRRAQRSQQWAPRDYCPPHRRRVGILGAGVLGMASAERLHQQGFQVRTFSARSDAQVPWTHHCGPLIQTDLAELDLVVSLLPDAPTTRGVIDRNFWHQCRPQLGFISFGRSAAVVDSDLRDALDQGWVGEAVLDVFDIEPLPADDWKYGHERVTVLPHISAQTPVDTAARVIAETLNRYFTRGDTPPLVDPAKGY